MICKVADCKLKFYFIFIFMLVITSEMFINQAKNIFRWFKNILLFILVTKKKWSHMLIVHPSNNSF